MSAIYLTGVNASSMFGLGDSSPHYSFELLPGSWAKISLGLNFAVAVKTDGTLWGCGSNASAQLGLGSASYSSWTQIGSDTDWADVAVGESFTLALKSSGALYACGLNDKGQCGQNHTASPVTTLSAVYGSHAFAQIVCDPSARHAFAIDNSGALWGWGENGYPVELGSPYCSIIGTGFFFATYLIPTAVSLPAAIIGISTGRWHTEAILDTESLGTQGKLYAWGYNAMALGDYSGTDYTPTQIGTDSNWSKVLATKNNTYAIKSNGTAWSWGEGSHYELGRGTNSSIGVPTQIGSATDWADVAAPVSGLILQKTDGSVYVCGTVATAFGNGNVTTTTLKNLETDLSITLPVGTRSLAAGIDSTQLIISVPPAPTGTPTAPTLLTITSPVGTPMAPTRLDIVGIGIPSAPTRLSVVDGIDSTHWTLACQIDGAVVSLTGTASVDIEEGAARVAMVQLRPAPGIVVPMDYVGRAVVLDFVPVYSGVGVPIRIFSGRIERPEYLPETGIMTLSCTDNLQNRVATLRFSDIDALTGAGYSVAVSGGVYSPPPEPGALPDPAINKLMVEPWDYAQAEMSALAASLDADASGQLRVTPWQGLGLYRTLADGDLLYGSSSVSFPRLSNIVNSVDVSFSYRYPRLRQRFGSVGWSGTLIDMHVNGYQYPTRQDIQSAVQGAGWTPLHAVYSPAPTAIAHPSGGMVVPSEGSVSMAVVSLTQRHSQTVEEAYGLTVRAPESIAINGLCARQLSGALESQFNASAWEADLRIMPLFTSNGEIDYMSDAPRAMAAAALQTLLDQARVKILASHRTGRVGNAMPIDPFMDVDKRVAIATSAMTADGKLVRVVHQFDLMAGSAITEFEIAHFALAGAGLIAPSALTPPASPAAAVTTQDWPSEIPSLQVNNYGVTPYTDALMGLLANPLQAYAVENVPDGLGGYSTISYSNPFYIAGTYPETGFRVSMPGVDDADRNPITRHVTGTYDLVIAEDPLSFTAI